MKAKERSMDPAQLLLEALAELAEVKKQTHTKKVLAKLEHAIALINEAHHALTT
jgi:hypothetical protein